MCWCKLPVRVWKYAWEAGMRDPWRGRGHPGGDRCQGEQQVPGGRGPPPVPRGLLCEGRQEGRSWAEC